MKKADNKFSVGIIVIVVVVFILYISPYAFVMWIIYGIAKGDTRPTSYYSEAKIVDKSCKIYYQDIINGYSSISGEGQYVELLPDIKDKKSRKELAVSLTIGDALKYNKTDNYIESLDILVADTEGNIFWKDDPANPKRDISPLILTTETTLGELYGQQSDP